MNPEWLLKHFEQISEAPDAVPRLRRFILDLAVRGKLVEQNPEDEPASELLKRIEEKKARLVKAGEIRNQKTLLPINEGKTPFETPKAWEWIRLGDIGDWGSGCTPPRGNSEYYGSGITWLKSGELEDKLDLRGSEETVTEKALEKCSFRLNKAGDILIAMYGATIGKLAILGEAAVTNQAVCGCTPFEGISNRYLFVFLLSQRDYFHSQSEGGAQPNISKIKIVNFGFPLPPLAEQHRIVAKVDELMALCDELEAAQAKRERRRDRLVAATLHGLNNGNDSSEPDGHPIFEKSARFYFNHLPRLTTRPEHIQQLRQTILNLAVRGKLLPQDPKDEPASELFKKIGTEVSRLVKSGEIRNRNTAEPVTEAPFRLPTGWKWVDLLSLGITQTGNTPSKNNPEYFGSYIPFVKPADLTGREINYDGEGISQEGLPYARLIPAESVLMVCIGSSIGKVNRTKRDISCNQQINTITPFITDCGAFLTLALKAEFFQKLVIEQAGMGTLPIISKGKWEKLPVPLPPLVEQNRIVAKVDELMALCDKLEARLTTKVTARRQLLEATLANAISGGMRKTEGIASNG